MKQMSESFQVGALLAFVGGYLDAYTYTIRGHVFANAQTGNIAFFGMNIANRDFKEAISYLVPVFAFVMGILVSEKIRTGYCGRLHWRQPVMIFEIITLTAVGFIPCGKFNDIVNCMISFVCAMQVQSFKKINGTAVSTTVCTGNLRSTTEYVYNFFKTRDKQNLYKSLIYVSIILLFTLGAVIGAAVTSAAGTAAVWLCSAVLAVVCAMMNVKQI